MDYKPLIIIFILATQSAAQTTFDPLTISVGARAMGMGKAYVAVAEHGDTIFTNPAGLGEIDSFRFTSMAARIMEEVDYTVLGGVYPLGKKSAVGLGYAAASTSGIDIRDARGTYLRKSNYGNSVLLVSYGRKLAEKTSLGLNLKYYIQEANEITDGNGSAVNLDVGYLQKGLGWFSIGAVAENVLRSSKLRYENGEEEELPLLVKLGTRLHIMGEEFESAVFSPIKLVAVADINLNLQSSEPTTAHLGMELSPNPNLTLRAGIDQDPKGAGVQNYLTSGVSVHLAGIGFHYAYHPYTETDLNAVHYFSVSFDERGWPQEGPPDAFLGSVR